MLNTDELPEQIVFCPDIIGAGGDFTVATIEDLDGVVHEF